MADSQTAPLEPITAADGTPLKKKLAQALFRSRVRAVSLVVPLFAFVMASFVIPIFALMWQGVYNDRFSSHMPNLTEQLTMWDGLTEPNEKMYEALVADLKTARADRTIGRAATRCEPRISRNAIIVHINCAQGQKIKATFQRKRHQGQQEMEQYRSLAGHEDHVSGSYTGVLRHRA
jgi:putative spermidine/putrescine transport system permease protein